MVRRARQPMPRRDARRPGRPTAGGDAVRESLLQTARDLFLARGFGAVSIRQIAAAAGSSPATIHYHFGDKLGLYRAMLEAAMVPVMDALQRLGDPDRAGPIDVAALVRLYARMLVDNPWVPALIVQEVLSEGGHFREQFIEHFAGRLAPLFIGVIHGEQARGALRGDLDPRLAALSVISLTVFPFLARPLVSRVLGVSPDQESVERLVDHTTRVLLDGIRATEPPA